MINKDIKLLSLAEQLHFDYLKAKPFSHTVIDNLISSELLNAVSEEFNIKDNNSMIFNNPNDI